jgi:hypothetical protein
MNKEELTKAIEDGILKGFWKPIAYFIVGITICELLFIGFLFYEDYKETNCSKYGTCQPTSTVAEQSCFPLENLKCQVIIGNSTDNFWNTGYFEICGYQEANAYYEQLKPRIEEDVREDIAFHNGTRNETIKYLECN